MVKFYEKVKIKAEIWIRNIWKLRTVFLALLVNQLVFLLTASFSAAILILAPYYYFNYLTVAFLTYCLRMREGLPNISDSCWLIHPM